MPWMKILCPLPLSSPLENYKYISILSTKRSSVESTHYLELDQEKEICQRLDALLCPADMGNRSC